MVTRIEENRGIHTSGNGKKTPRSESTKYLNTIMKAKRKSANAAKRTAAETQEFLKWALKNCNNQGDLDAIRELVNSHGTAKQRKAFEKMEYDFKKAAKAPKAPVVETPKTPEAGSKKARRIEIAKAREEKLAMKENFRQAMFNAESVDDLKALEKEYGKNFTGSLKATYNARLHALEKAASEAATAHNEAQGVYNRLFSYGNDKHPSNTPLGNGKPSASTGMTWERYAKQNGLPYTKPEVSGVVKADQLAQEAIERNRKHGEMQKFYEELFSNADDLDGTHTNNGGVVEVVEDLGDGKNNSGNVVDIIDDVDNGKHNGGVVDVIDDVDNTNKNKGKGKFKMPKLGKKGKFALATLALGLIGGTIAYLVGKGDKKATPTTPSGEPIKPGLIPADSTKVEKKDSVAITPVITPIVTDSATVARDTIEQKVVGQIPFDTQSGKYVVRKGDNCWNIAKAELIKEKGGEIPSDKEVMERTLAIIKRNSLHFEADKYTVLIYPNDTLNIKM